VQACIRRGNAAGIPVVVVHKGDATRGSVLVKLNRLDGSCVVLAETQEMSGARAWIKGTGTEPVAEAAADDYIARNRKYDPDLWVIEIEDREGRLPFEATILAL